MRLTCFFAAGLVFFSLACKADTLDQQTSGTNPNAAGFFGQSFAVAGTGTYTDITFSFYAYPGTAAAYALGTGYLFSSPYTGAPTDLSASDANFIGSAVANAGAYAFGSFVTLTAGNGYFFYEDAALPESAITGQAAARSFFYASSASSNFTQYVGRSNDYEVTGTSTAASTAPANTPEPSSLFLLGTGLLSGIAVFKRRLA